MLPVVTEIVHVYELSIFSRSNSVEIELRLVLRVIVPEFIHEKRLVRYSINYELMKMAIGPAHYDLENHVQLMESNILRDKYPSPDWGSDAQECYLELIEPLFS